jgi:AraC family transcriptional regulator
MEQLLAVEVGLTPHGYLDRRRLEFARHLVMRSDVPLKQAAHELGFRHASHFTKWFRRHMGAAPSAFRNAQDGGAA